LTGHSIPFHGSAVQASGPLLCICTGHRKSRGPQIRPAAQSLRAAGGESVLPAYALPYVGEFRVIRQKGKGLGERLAYAFRTLLRCHPSCVVIGTDAPLFPTRILRQALRELHTCESVLGPCPDGGYYLIALRRPANPGRLRGIFRRVRWGTAFAFSDTLRNLLRLGLSCSVLEECADVDLPQDVQRLKKNLSRDRTARRLAPATWRFLKGSAVRCKNPARESAQLTGIPRSPLPF
jgi:hypothetical protein